MKSSEINYEIAKAIGDIDDKFIEKEYGIRKIRKISKTILILVAVIGLLTGGAYYSGLLSRTVDTYSSKLGNSAVQMQLINKLGIPVGKSVTNNGITLTVDAILGDDTTAMVVYSLTNEDKTMKLPEISEGEIFFFDWQDKNGVDDYPGINKIYTGTGYRDLEVVDTDPNDGMIEVIEYLNYRELPKGKIVSAKFNNLVLRGKDWSAKTDISEMIYEGLWEIDFLFDYTDSSKTLSKNESFIHNETEINIERLWITPFSINVKLYMDKIDEEQYRYYNDIDLSKVTDELYKSIMINDEGLQAIENYMFADTTFLNKIPFFYTTVTGEVVDISGEFGGNHSSSDPYFYGSRQHRYEEIIPFDDIVSVTFGDLTFNVTDVETIVSEVSNEVSKTETNQTITQKPNEHGLVGSIKTTDQVILSERDYSEIASISLTMDCTEVPTLDFDEVLETYSVYTGSFSKETPEFDEFLEIYTSYILQPIEYENYDSESFNTLDVKMQSDHDFIFSNGYEAPIMWFDVILWGEEKEIIENFRLHSNGISLYSEQGYGDYLPYTIGNQYGAEYKEKLLALWDKYPESIEFGFSFN